MPSSGHSIEQALKTAQLFTLSHLTAIPKMVHHRSLPISIDNLYLIRKVQPQVSLALPIERRRYPMSIQRPGNTNRTIPLRQGNTPPHPPTIQKPPKNQPKDTGDRLELSSINNYNHSYPSLPEAEQFLQETFPSAKDNLHFSVCIAGELGHVLWGSKPMAWLGNGSNTDKSWTALKTLANSGIPVRDKYILLDTEELAPNSGFIINKQNLRNMLNEYPEILDSWPELKKIPADLLMSQFETLNPVSRALLASDQTLGALLGYGPNNAFKWSRLNDRPTFGPPLDHLPDTSIPHEEMRKNKDTLTIERNHSKMQDMSFEILDQDPSPYKVNPPGFVAFDDSPETQELVTRYLEDSFLIRDHLETQRYRDPVGPNREPLRSYPDFLASLLLKNIFQFGPEPPHPNQYLYRPWH
jgi:hypothetical protein